MTSNSFTRRDLLGKTSAATAALLLSNFSLADFVFAGETDGEEPVPFLKLPRVTRKMLDWESLDDWLNVHEYLVRVLRKFQGDMGVLQRAAAEIVGPFKDTQDFATFSQWFKGARLRVPALRLVFSSDSGCQAALARLKLNNLDTGILGEEFPESIITVAGDVDHFQLMGPESVAAHVDEVVTEARARRPPSHA